MWGTHYVADDQRLPCTIFGPMEKTDAAFAPDGTHATESHHERLAAAETSHDERLRANVRAAGRGAKIVCTIGPASASEAMIRELMRTGMDVARLNFSHGTHEEHARIMERLRRAAQKEERSICILQDLQGPKMRTGRLRHRTSVALQTGSRMTLTPRDVPGTAAVLSTTVPTLAQDAEPGDQILLSDGLIELRVVAVGGADVECEVMNGGILHEHQGINLPGKAVSVPSLTDKDIRDLEFGIKHEVDVIAMS